LLAASDVLPSHEAAFGGRNHATFHAANAAGFAWKLFSGCCPQRSLALAPMGILAQLSCICVHGQTCNLTAN